MTAYAGTAELARVLRLREPTGAQGTAMERVLEDAAWEINSECLGAGTVWFGTPYPATVVDVNLARAVETWHATEAAGGILVLGTEGIPIRLAADTWNRHANRLVPFKTVWGMA